MPTDETNSDKKPERAAFGAKAFEGDTDELPDVFPRTMGPNCWAYLKEVVDGGLVSDMVGRFEQRFAEEMGVKHCIGAPGCSNALQILMSALAFDPGDEIIISPVADYGTVMGALFEDLIPVFCDTAQGTANVTAETIRPHITGRTRAILLVHVAGAPCDMDGIMALAEEHELPVYEDACQALFSEYKGRAAGSFGHAAAYSFDAEKTMGSDIGGCVITNDDSLANRLRFMGQSRGAEEAPGFGRCHVERGLALRMTHSTAAICLGQLETIREEIATRDHSARAFAEAIADIPGLTPYPIPDYCTFFSCWMYGFSIDPDVFSCDAETFASQLSDRGIPNAGLGRYYLMPAAIRFLNEKVRTNQYPYSIPPASHQYDYSAVAAPNAAAFLEHFIRWFWTEKYTDEHVERMAAIVREVAAANGKA